MRGSSIGRIIMGGKPRSQPSSTPRPPARPSGDRAAGRRRKPIDWRDARAGHIASLLEVLQRTWPEATIELDHQNPYQLLVATLLSAQTTDQRVNLTTPALFARFPDPAALAAAEPEELEQLIHATGFFRTKAKHLRAMAAQLVARHGGAIPTELDQLTALPGVARKTANLVLGAGFGIASGIAVDTHVQRVSQRLGLTSADRPDQIEAELTRLVPRSHWIDFTQRMIWHGRRVCQARKPACAECPLASLCAAREA
jgi:endonuclease-3